MTMFIPVASSLEVFRLALLVDDKLVYHSFCTVNCLELEYLCCCLGIASSLNHSGSCVHLSKNLQETENRYSIYTNNIPSLMRPSGEAVPALNQEKHQPHQQPAALTETLLA